MTRRKTKLWLNRPKKSEERNRQVPVHWPYNGTPIKCKRLRQSCTPRKASTSSKKLFYHEDSSYRTPQKPTKRMLTPKSSAKKSKRQMVKTPVRHNKENVIEENVIFDEISEEEISEEQKDFLKIVSDKEVLQILSAVRILYILTNFFLLVKQGRYPLKNLALLLWLETVKWYSCSTLQEMRFWKTTKQFWRAGYRLFQGKFISFMSGPRSIGTYVTRGSKERNLDPLSSEINFAIPSRNNFVDNKESGIPSVLKPGIISQSIKSVNKSPVSKVNMMCLDAKKVTAGLDNDYGDVDMFGHEQSPTLSEQKERLSREESLINEIRNSVDETDVTVHENISDENTCIRRAKIRDIVDMLCALVFVLTIRLKEGRILKRKQEYGLVKLKERAGSEWKTSKYVFTISNIQAFLYRVKQFITRTLSNIDQLCFIGSKLNGTNSYMHDSVMQCSQRNMFILKPYDGQMKPVPTNLVKQRSTEWHQIRKLAPVTGSTLHNAIGLRTLSLQKKHFDSKILGKEEPEPSDTIKKYFEHGTKNEPNAVATLTGKFLPMFHPNLAYVEEGCYLIYGSSISDNPTLVVSPDGSLRDTETHRDKESCNVGDCRAAIEIKCPYPKPDVETIYYSIPEYYLCQCLAEMKAEGVKSMIFICYTAESTTFFEVDFDEEIWKLLQEECEELYGNIPPKRPTKIRSSTKVIKEKLSKFSENCVRLLVELPSIDMANTDVGESTLWTNSPYYEHTATDATNLNNELKNIMAELHPALTESYDCLQTGHQLSRRKANEVMVWVLSNKDRYWSAELPNSLIVAYGLKDYRLTVDQLRAATDDVLRECKQNGLDVPLMAFDGQWYQLMVRDGEGKPLTQLQVQKDVWTGVTKLKKKVIVDRLVDLNKVNFGSGRSVSESGIDIRKINNVLVISSTDHAFQTIRTNRNPKHWNRSTTVVTEGIEDEDFNTNSSSQENLNWIPDDVLEAIEKSGDSELLATISSISKDINQLITSVNSEKDDSEYVEQVQAETVGTDSDLEQTHLQDELSDNDYTDMLDELLKSKRSEKWKRLSYHIVKDFMSNATKMTSFTKAELEILVQVLKSKFELNCIECKRNWTKEKLINTICKLLGNGTTLSHKKKRKKVPTLKIMAEKVLRGKFVPKQILNIAYAQYLFPHRLEQWKSNSPIGSSCSMKLNDVSLEVEWYSYPEMNKATESLLYKTLDSHHLLTNLRIRTSTRGLQDVSPTAWKKVASSFETKLTPGMVEDLTDKQSNAFAQTHFSKEVEDVMIKHGDVKEAELCNLVRKWYEAEDQPALTVSERVTRWLAFKSYLLKGVTFNAFPPASQFIKGFSLIAFDGFLTGIDTKMQLYARCGSYCVRTVSSLPAETAVGGIQDMNINRSMTVKAKDVPRIISSLTEVMTYKCNPDRGFFMKTSRSSVYRIVEGENKSDNDKSDLTRDTCVPQKESCQTIKPLDHAFDRPGRRRTKARRKLGELTGDLDAPPKGTQPMRRMYHKCDESKVLPSKRAGLFPDI